MSRSTAGAVAALGWWHGRVPAGTLGPLDEATTPARPVAASRRGSSRELHASAKSFRAKSTVYGTLSVMRGMGDYLVREGVWSAIRCAG